MAKKIQKKVKGLNVNLSLDRIKNERIKDEKFCSFLT